MIVYKEQLELIKTENELLSSAIKELIYQYKAKTGVGCSIQISEHSMDIKCETLTSIIVRIEAIIK